MMKHFRKTYPYQGLSVIKNLVGEKDDLVSKVDDQEIERSELTQMMQKYQSDRKLRVTEVT